MRQRKNVASTMVIALIIRSHNCANLLQSLTIFPVIISWRLQGLKDFTLFSQAANVFGGKRLIYLVSCSRSLFVPVGLGEQRAFS